MTNQSNEPMTESEALIKLIEMGNQEIEKGNFQTAEEFFDEMKNDNNFSLHKAKENDLPPKQG